MDPPFEFCISVYISPPSELYIDVYTDLLSGLYIEAYVMWRGIPILRIIRTGKKVRNSMLRSGHGETEDPNEESVDNYAAL